MNCSWISPSWSRGKSCRRILANATPALVFAFSTIATYVLLCVISTAGLQRVRLGEVERYGEVLSGAFIALVGVAFWLWPVM